MQNGGTLAEIFPRELRRDGMQSRFQCTETSHYQFN
jgi:hypothetical protein